MAMSKKQVTFDIDTNLLKEYYPEKNWRRAYDDIRKFMEENSFEWIQGCLYVSTIPMSSITVSLVIEKIIDTYPWLNVCVHNCVMTEIGETHHYSKDGFPM